MQRMTLHAQVLDRNVARMRATPAASRLRAVAQKDTCNPHRPV
jgi:hypothetical protein